MFLHSLSLCLHTVCSNLLQSNVYSFLIHGVYFTSSTVCSALSILHSSLKLSVFLSKAHRHGSICLSFSFPVWGVYLIPCSCAQHTSNTHAAKNEKKRQKGGHTQKAYRWWNDVEWERCVCVSVCLCVCGENQDEHVRAVEGKILNIHADTVKKMVNYYNIHT